MTILETRDLTKAFKGLLAVDGVTFAVQKGEISCLIGPNGAGKSTLLKLIAGFLTPTSGTVVYHGREITRALPHLRAQWGILTKFQVTNLYENLTVRENVWIPAQKRVGDGQLRGVRGVEERVDHVLRDIGLLDRQDIPASQLSHGERQWLEIGMVLATAPGIMLLDEPTAGMTSEETRATARMLKRLAEETGTTMIVVEHDMHFVREIARRVWVMHLGRILTEGSLDEIEASEQVRRVYLGQA